MKIFSERELVEMPLNTEPMVAIKEWRELLGERWVGSMANLAKMSPPFFRKVKEAVVDATDRAAIITDSMSHKEQVAYAFGMGTHHLAFISRSEKPLAALVVIANAVDIYELKAPIDQILMAISRNAHVFLVLADLAMGVPNRLVEQLEAIEADIVAREKEIATLPGVH